MLGVEFIVNVNTYAQRRAPYYSQLSACEIVDSSGQPKRNSEDDSGSYLIALKTEQSVAIIKLRRGQARMLHQLEFSEKFMTKQPISYHSFVHTRCEVPSSSSSSSSSSSAMSTTIPTSTLSSSSANIFVSFQTGQILVMNSISKNFVYNFNTTSEKGDEVWHERRVTKICTMPGGNSFLVLFVDSTIVEYGLNAKQENFEFQSDIEKLKQQISFQPKKFGSSIQRKNYGTFEYSSTSEKDFMAFACYIKDETEFCGPNKYVKFKCPSISDFAILPKRHPLAKLVQGRFSRDTLLIAYTGLDGLFRIVDLVNLEPVYAYQSYYGGINSFAFDGTLDASDYDDSSMNLASPLISLACQDDSIVVLNTRLNTTWRIVGHNSFVSCSIFTKVSEDIVRVTAASFDGCVSFTDFKREEVDSKSIEDAALEDYLPVRAKFNMKGCINVKIAHKQLVNSEGVPFLLGFNTYFMTSAFDGCASLFRFCESLPGDKSSGTDQQEEDNRKIPQFRHSEDPSMYHRGQIGEDNDYRPPASFIKKDQLFEEFRKDKQSKAETRDAEQEETKTSSGLKKKQQQHQGGMDRKSSD